MSGVKINMPGVYKEPWSDTVHSGLKPSLSYGLAARKSSNLLILAQVTLDDSLTLQIPLYVAIQSRIKHPIMSNIPQVGQPAPDFSTPDQNGNAVTLDDLSSQWVILYFYPKDDTPGCTTEATDFTELYQDFSALGAKILGVSPDLGKSHCKFISKHNLSITLLSDPEHILTEAYGAWRLKKFMGKEYMGVARSTFLISPDKMIVYTWPNVKAKGHAQAVLTKLQELAAT